MDMTERKEPGSTPNSYQRKDAVVPLNVLETGNLDLLRALSWVLHQDPLEALRRAIQEWIQVEDIYFAPSGESAIAQILSLLPQQEVVMPAWICHQVKVAARVAGKRIVYVDLAKGGINATSAEYAEAARPGRILLIAHLFGVPTDVAAICELAKKRDCVTIEDAVPAVGGRLNGRLLGTFGDFGVFSFEQSKRIPALRGGFIVANNRQLISGEKLDRFRVVKTSSVMPVFAFAKAFTQNLATNLHVYRAVTTKLLPLRPLVRQALTAAKGLKVPAIGSRRTGNEQQVRGEPREAAPRNPFYTREVHPYQAELALPLINRIGPIGEKIARLASVYANSFRDTSIAVLLPPECDMSGLMRFPIAFPGKDRSQILQRAQGQEIYLKVMWGEGVGLEGLPNSLWVARNLVLLPLYTALSVHSAECLAKAIVEIDRSTSPE